MSRRGFLRFQHKNTARARADVLRRLTDVAAGRLAAMSCDAEARLLVPAPVTQSSERI